MALHHKIYRTFITQKLNLLSALRKMHYRLKYPSLKIDGKTFISENCVIVCVDEARCEISNCHLAQGVMIVAEKKGVLTMRDSYIGPNSVIVAYEHIDILPHCAIAEMVVIRDQNHQFGTGKLIKDLGYETGKIIIGENVWIGAKATILKNVTIGKNSVIGAHSLVNKSLPDNSVAGGIPAKPLSKT